MDGTETTDGLAWWAGPGQDPMTAFARAQAHPARVTAVRALAARMVELFARDPLLAQVLKDAGCYVAAMLAFLLGQGGELTLPRLKRACASSGLLSPGRARAQLQFLEHVGYVTRQGRSGAAVAYALTPAFQAAWRLQLRAALEAVLPMEPTVAALLDRPAAIAAFGRVHAAALLDSTAAWGEPPAFLRVFQHPYGGIQIVWTLILADDQADDFAPARVGPISISALARRLEVSRIHVKRIFQDAEREGLGGLGPDGVVWLSEAARHQMRLSFIGQLAHILAAAGRAASDLGLASADDQECSVGMISFGD